MEWALLAAAAVLFLTSIVVLLLVFARLPRAGDGRSELRLAEMQQHLAALSQIFRGSQSRGVIGETLLAELLRTWLAKGQYELQYGFRSGVKADAVVRIGDRIVAVDAKFPSDAISRAMAGAEAPDTGASNGGANRENLSGGGATAARAAGNTGTPDGTASGDAGAWAEARKTLLRHADAIAERYIRPAEGTVDFALLYLPSEAHFHFLFVERSPELFAELGGRGVIPVSPGTLFLYIQTMLFGLSGAALPEDKRERARRIEGIRVELHDFATLFYRAGAHLRNATKNFEEAETQLSRVERHVASLLGRNRD